ncbi:MAG: methylated-DNA--[protein]-cysteine S-methyltransferase, partial [Chitinophagaceae bacterium]
MDSPYTTYYQSPVGLLRISGTAGFITEVTFCKEPIEQDSDSGEMPAMVIQCVEQLIQYFNGQRRVFELPLNQTGTSFQQQTWNLLTAIPFGKTISYLQLAVSTGDPKATRAVANANGRNNIAIIVPCHRVIGSNRELTG